MSALTDMSDGDLRNVIDSYYRQWGGRGVQTGEANYWVGVLHTGVATLDTLRVALVDDVLGRTYLPSFISAQYQRWGGRAANSGEIAYWTGAFRAGTANLDTFRATLVDDTLGRTYLPGAISASYLQWGGRAASGNEVNYWTGVFRAGTATFDTLRAALIDDQLGRNYLPGAISASYLQWGGRAANANEVAYWTGVMRAGTASFDTLRMALVDDVLGRTYLPTVINAQYQQWGGRAASANEIVVWTGVMRAGTADANSIRTAIVDDPLGRNYLPVQIDTVYQQLGGRAATTADISFWMSVFRGGTATIANVKEAVFAAPSLGQTYLPAQIVQAMASYGGRAPTSAELAQWMAWLHDSGSVAGLHDAIVSDRAHDYWASQLTNYLSANSVTASEADVQALLTALRGGTGLAASEAAILASHGGGGAGAAQSIQHGTLVDTIYDAFAAFIGHAPSTADLTQWQQTLAASTGPAAALRTALLSSTEGQAHLTAEISAIYQQWANRTPTGAEIATWRQSITAGGSIADIRKSILSGNDGHAHFADAVAATYQDYLGRAPTSAEQSDAAARLASTGSFAAVQATTFVSPEGTIHFFDQLRAMFSDLLGRDFTGAEQTTWFNHIYFDSTEYATMRVALMLDPQALVTRQWGTSDADTLVVHGSVGETVIRDFDAAHDKIQLDQATYAGVNPLDNLHARQVLSVDGVTPEVLITFGDHQHLLLHGVDLSQLSASNFLFG